VVHVEGQQYSKINFVIKSFANSEPILWIFKIQLRREKSNVSFEGYQIKTYD
jgi:hypothetical protein